MTRSLPLSRAQAALAVVSTLLVASAAQAKNLTSATGSGDAYAILGKSFTIETPDCGHKVPHITQDMDPILKKGVFVYHLHVKAFLDSDRCGATDRQRTEIRAKSADIVANQGDTIYYNWKFKLPAGFQTSPNFTHIMQIKSDQAAPILTLTPRGTNLSTDGRFGVHGTAPLSKFIDTWVVARMKVVFSHTGSVSLTISRLSDGAELLSYTGPGNMWDDNSGGGDFKAGIYRSLTTPGDLRDEDDLRFADFCGSKVSAADCEDGSPTPTDAGAGTGGDDAGAGGDDAGAGGDDATPGDDAGGSDDAAGGTGGDNGSAGTGGSGGSGAAGSGGASATGGSGSGDTGGSRGGGSSGNGGSATGGHAGSNNGGSSSGGCDVGSGRDDARGFLVAGLALAMVFVRRRRR